MATVPHDRPMDLVVDGLTFRQAVDTDYEELWQLRRVALYEHVLATWGWDEDWQASRFRDRWRPEQITVVERGGECIGMFALEEDPEELNLANVAIAPAHQSQGIGTAVLTAILTGARSRGLVVSLTVLKVNRARRLYERLGFVVVGETATHYVMRAEPGPHRTEPLRSTY